MNDTTKNLAERLGVAAFAIQKWACVPQRPTGSRPARSSTKPTKPHGLSPLHAAPRPGPRKWPSNGATWETNDRYDDIKNLKRATFSGAEANLEQQPRATA